MIQGNGFSQTEMLLVEERQMLAILKQAGNRQGWYGKEGKMIIAVSGGSDSVCMLWLLMHLKDPEDLVVAHVNHRFRPGDAERDAKFVKNLADTLKLEFRGTTIDVPGLKKRGESLEEAGRRLRYGFLEACANEFDAKWIAVGHTADDQVETVLHNILRGCGIRGLAGIPEKRGKIVRPVMDLGRSDLMKLLKFRGLPWVTDATNVNTAYLRNRIRHDLIPYLECSYNPKTREHLLGLAEDARRISRKQTEWAENLALRIRTRVPCAFQAWNRKALVQRGADNAVDFIVEECRALGLKVIERRRLKTLADLLLKQQPWRFQWQDSIEMCGGAEKIILMERNWLSEKCPPAGPLPLERYKGTIFWGLWIFSWRPVSCSRSDTSDTSESPDSWRIFLPEEETRGCILTAVSTFQKEYRQRTPVPWCFRNQWPVIVFPSGRRWIPAYDNGTEREKGAGSSSGIVIEAQPASRKVRVK
ncbi:MAG: tRNA lysidine(34) synthetase TilS [Thermovirgaceae bacterium]